MPFELSLATLVLEPLARLLNGLAVITEHGHGYDEDTLAFTLGSRVLARFVYVTIQSL